MTLNEKLMEMEDTDKIKLGCKDGSGYFFIGSVADFRNDKDVLNKHWYAYTLTLIHKTEVTAKNFEPYRPQYEREIAEIEQLLENGETKELKDRLSYLVGLIKTQEARLKSIAILKEHVANGWVKFEDREVTDSYKLLEKPYVGIIIDGLTKGGFWFESEYVVAKNKNNNNEEGEVNEDED